MSENVEYEKLIYENEIKGYRLYLVLNTYKGQQYIHLRKYFLSYEGEWIPSQEGVSMVASMSNIFALIDGLIEMCSQAEVDDSILKHFGDRLSGK